MSCVLQDGEAVVCDCPEDDGGTQDARLAEDVHIEHMGNADEQEGQDLATEPFEADGGAELLIADRAHHAGDVVHDHEDEKRIEQAVVPAEEIAEPGADGGESSLDHVPEISQNKNLLKNICNCQDSLSSALQVSGPTTPSTTRPCSRWKPRTDSSSSLPKLPSSGPV